MKVCHTWNLEPRYIPYVYLTYVVILLYHYLYYVVYISNVVHILILDRVAVVGSKLSLLHMSPFPTLLFLSLEDFQCDAPFLEKINKSITT